ncbi:hypothetical protein HN51_016754 [Arachis hypogaea]
MPRNSNEDNGDLDENRSPGIQQISQFNTTVARQSEDIEDIRMMKENSAQGIEGELENSGSFQVGTNSKILMSRNKKLKLKHLARKASFGELNPIIGLKRGAVEVEENAEMVGH